MYRSPDFVFLACEPLGLGFQRSASPPSGWPGGSQPLRTHLDFKADSPDQLDDLEARAVALGAQRPSRQPRREAWRVLLDPAGRPFCLTSITG